MAYLEFAHLDEGVKFHYKDRVYVKFQIRATVSATSTEYRYIPIAIPAELWGGSIEECTKLCQLQRFTFSTDHRHTFGVVHITWLGNSYQILVNDELLKKFRYDPSEYRVFTVLGQEAEEDYQS